MGGVIIGLLCFILLLQMLILWVIFQKKKQRENEYYTDYVHNKLILRIYKPEFEYQAIGNISRDKLLDGGTFSLYYKWALIQG
jgi:hypothetical protein